MKKLAYHERKGGTEMAEKAAPREPVDREPISVNPLDETSYDPEEWLSEAEVAQRMKFAEELGELAEEAGWVHDYEFDKVPKPPVLPPLEDPRPMRGFLADTSEMTSHEIWHASAKFFGYDANDANAAIAEMEAKPGGKAWLKERGIKRVEVDRPSDDGGSGGQE